MPPATPNGWDVWGAHVLAEVQRLAGNDERIEEHLVGIREEIMALRTEVAKLKVYAGIGGALAGLVGGIVMRLIAAGLGIP